MSKYVCDFSQVSAVGDKLIESAESMIISTNQYSSNISSDLSGWNGQAKSAFTTQCSSLVDTTTQKAEYIRSFGEFIKSASQSIEQLDEELSSQNI